eukprot:scaffold1928_cov381-Prasinococcus_capsulatus_cf.AAC.32
MFLSTASSRPDIPYGVPIALILGIQAWPRPSGPSGLREGLRASTEREERSLLAAAATGRPPWFTARGPAARSWQCRRRGGPRRLTYVCGRSSKSMRGAGELAATKARAWSRRRGGLRVRSRADLLSSHSAGSIIGGDAAAPLRAPKAAVREPGRRSVDREEPATHPDDRSDLQSVPPSIHPSIHGAPRLPPSASPSQAIHPSAHPSAAARRGAAGARAWTGNHAAAPSSGAEPIHQ